MTDTCMWTGLHLDAEVITLKLDLKYVKPIYIMWIYRPPDRRVTDFIDKIEDIVNAMYERPNFELCITGDLNIDLLKPRDINTRRYNEFLARHALSNIIYCPTCYYNDRIKATLIDHFTTTDAELYSQNGVCPMNLSDHYPSFAARKKFKQKSSKTKLRARKYKNLEML